MSVFKSVFLLGLVSLLLVACSKQDTCTTGSAATLGGKAPACTPASPTPNTPTTTQASNISKVSSFDDFASRLVKDSNKVAVLVISSASNCSSCKTVDGYLPAVAAKHAGTATYYLADPYAAEEFMEYVESIPTFYVLTHYGESWEAVDVWEGANTQSFVEQRVASFFQGSVSRMAAAQSSSRNDFAHSRLQRDLYR